jgi:translation initiation factor IF-2
LAKRIHDIAKELGISSKVIIDKCVAEGVPAEAVKNHMAVVKAGLEASIREWFSSGGVATAIESTEHVDAESLKPKPARRKARPVEAPPDEPLATEPAPASGGESAPTVEVKDVPPAPRPAPIDEPVAHTPAPAPAAPLDRAPEALPAAPAQPTKVAPPAPTARPDSPAPKPVAITPPVITPAAAAAPTAPHTPGQPPAHGPSHGPSHAPANRPHPPAGPPPRTVVKPAPMNVPTRPQVIKPVGQQLTEKAKITLAGPRVIRVEAPEQIDVRAPRRPGPGGAGPSGGRGVVGGGGAGTDDRRVSRNKRRGPADNNPIPARRRATAAEDMPVGTGFSEADLAEREARLARAGGYLKQRRREAKAREAQAGVGGAQSASGKVPITAPFTIKELAAATGIKSSDIIKKLFMQGVMATANSGIDVERAQEIMFDFDVELDVRTARTAEEVVSDVFTARKKLDERARAPIVTIMGHVDHGKTSLLDKIRNANVAAGEAGGITQKTSAFRTEIEVGGEKKHVVFLDTPGHQAFTEMRSRGATMTDVVVLVVGAPEGVMPQTIESINHAKAAKVPIVVAINKIDSPQATEAQVQKVMRQLAEQELNPVEWGGSTEIVKTSATKGTGVKELLETLDLQAQVLELKADFAGPARGRVVEASLDEGRGATATVMVQDGELKVGDFIVAGRAFGRVRDITDDQGNRIKSAGPSTPVQVSGIDEVPGAGDPFFVAETLKKAQEAAEQRRQRDRMAALHQPKVTLDSLFSQMKDANVKEILIVLKADLQGSVDVIKNEVERLSTGEVKVRVLHAAVGGITESDILLADASKAVVVGFNVIPTGKATGLAEAKGVEIRTYQVIYDITEDVKKAASGMLEPEIRQEILGHAEVRKVFKVTKVGTIAGCYITDGLVQRDALIRVTRNGIVIEQDRVLEQLKRHKDDAKDVRSGMECGMKIVGYDDIKEGDVLECYKKVEVKRTL